MDMLRRCVAVLVLVAFSAAILGAQDDKGEVPQGPASTDISPLAGIFIGTGVATSVAGSIILFQALPFKEDADRLFAASSATPATATKAESDAASAAFYTRFALGMGLSVGGILLATYGFYEGNSGMDYQRVSPPAKEETVSVVVNPGFVGVSLRW